MSEKIGTDIAGEDLAPCGMVLTDAKEIHRTDDLSGLCGECLKKCGFPADFRATAQLPTFAEATDRLAALMIYHGRLGYEPNRILFFSEDGAKKLVAFDSNKGGWQGIFAQI